MIVCKNSGTVWDAVLAGGVGVDVTLIVPGAGLAEAGVEACSGTLDKIVPLELIVVDPLKEIGLYIDVASGLGVGERIVPVNRDEAGELEDTVTAVWGDDGCGCLVIRGSNPVA